MLEVAAVSTLYILLPEGGPVQGVIGAVHQGPSLEAALEHALRHLSNHSHAD
jgi:hypothetical protein